jgi:hypothetical protein
LLPTLRNVNQLAMHNTNKDTTIYKVAQYVPGMEAHFYIQCKGLHSGRPLKKPIPNSFAVKSDIPYFFELVYAAYKSRLFEPHITGSVVPFIRIGSCCEVLTNVFLKTRNCPTEKLLAVKNLDEVVINAQKRVDLLMQLQQALAIELLR